MRLTARDDIVGSLPDFPDAEVTELDTYGSRRPRGDGNGEYANPCTADGNAYSNTPTTNRLAPAIPRR